MRLRSRLTYANVMSTLAFVIAMSGGVAYGATYLVSSNSQVGPKVIAGHTPPTGKHANIIPGSISGQDVAANSLYRYDIAGGLPCVIYQGSLPQGTNACSFLAAYPETGVQCFTISDHTPGGVVVSFDSGDAGFPVAFTSTDPTEITAAGCPAATNLLITTYAGTGGPLKDSEYTAIVS
jgi:hypothetical protein